MMSHITWNYIPHSSLENCDPLVLVAATALGDLVEQEKCIAALSPTMPFLAMVHPSYASISKTTIAPLAPAVE